MPYLIEKIDHVQLAAPKGSEQRARQFYKGILQFKEIEKPAVLQKRGGVWFHNGAVDIHIGIEENFVPAKKAHPAFHVKNIHLLKQHLIEASVTIMEDDNLPDANRFYIHDPFGNRIEFLEWE